MGDRGQAAVSLMPHVNGTGSGSLLDSILSSVQFSSVQSLSCIQLFATPWTAARQASLFITNSQSLLKPMSIESVMPSNYLILCHPLLLLPSIFPSIRVFSNEWALRIKLKTRSSDVWVVALFLSCSRWHSTTGFHSEWLLQPSCTRSCTSKPHSASSNKEHSLAVSRILNLCFFSFIFFLLSLFVLSLDFQFHQVFVRKLLVMHGTEFTQWPSCRLTSSFSLRVTKSLKTSLDSSVNISLCLQVLRP